MSKSGHFLNTYLSAGNRSTGMWVLVGLLLWVMLSSVSNANSFLEPWKSREQALVLDAYERNPIDWVEVVKDKNIRAFIGKSSDGLPPPYRCRMSDDAEKTLCKKTFQNYWLKRELYHTRRTAAKHLGLKWGAYHLGRPGNPIDQANHFIDFAEPEPDELIALDIEHDDPEKWISFEDAETFARHIKHRLGRYPVLYTNHNTAKRIAARKDEFPLLSRLPLWYARYKPDIRGVFPMGHWEDYALWQFSSNINCGKRRCPYRVRGAKSDIDVNATGLTVAEFEKKWPLGGLLPVRLNRGDVENQKTAVAKNSIKPIKPVRYKVSYLIKMGRKKIRLRRIAVPTPREREEIVDQITVASVVPDPVAPEMAVESALNSPSQVIDVEYEHAVAFTASFSPDQNKRQVESMLPDNDSLGIEYFGPSPHDAGYLH